MIAATTIPLAEPPYRPIAIAFHWLIALAIAVTFGLGTFMVELAFSPEKLRYFSWHKWAGMSIFLVTGLRLAWRLTHPVPRARADWQQVVARCMHGLLYVLMFAIPVSGWLMSSAKGVSTVYLGVWALPDLIGRNVEWAKQLQSLHFVFNYTLASAVLIHAGAALKHHLWDRDDVLVRMLPFLRASQHVE